MLRPSESGELLALRIGEDQAAAQPQALNDIVASCAGLPLALGIVAARAAMHPDFPVAALARVLHLLGELDRANLVAEHLPGRHAHHDLLHLYAGELADRLPVKVRRAAAERVAVT